LQYFKFNHVKIFTGYRDIAKLPKLKDIEYIHVSIPSIKEYNRFVLKDLHDYIVSSHYLIFQHDGFIVNPDNWDYNFLNYDYIGAVWSKRVWNTVNRVGNGGFSLRSKRLTKYYSTLNSNYSINEDKLICVDYYNILREEGFTFAPPELAARFSLEVNTEYNSDFNKVFGFHGSSRAPHLYPRTLKLINSIKLTSG